MSANLANLQLQSSTPGGSALVEVLPHALRTPIRKGGVISIDGGPMMSFDEARAFAKACGFGSYLNLLEWLSKNYGVPFKGQVVWPNKNAHQPSLSEV